MENQTPNQDPVVQNPVNQIPTNPEPLAQEPTIPVQETPVAEPEIPIQPIESETEITPKPEPEITPISEPVISPRTEMEIISPEPVEGSTEEQLKDLGVTTPPKTSSGFLKIIFIIALIIFIIVMVVLGLVYFKSQENTDNSDSNFDTVESTPTNSALQNGTCFLNDKTYTVGESFASADGCNTCSCASQDNIICTEKACITIPTITPTITPISTISAKKTTPTATPSAVKN